MDKTQVVNAALLGDRLRRIRKAHELSQAELATMLGLPQSWISELETGKRPHLDANTLARFCTALGVSADYLLGMTDDPTPVTGLTVVPTVVRHQATQNTAALALLEQWYATPDDHPPGYWDDLEEEITSHPIQFDDEDTHL
jgi:transcriptional regulator with XRE-family HTH domain